MEVVSNIHPNVFGLKVRHNSPQPSICVRTLSPITMLVNALKCGPFLPKHGSGLHLVIWRVQELWSGLRKSLLKRLHLCIASVDELESPDVNQIPTMST
jgi:hypothetical protein